MDVLRPATQADAAACGQICYDAFRAINEAHGFPADFPSAENAAGLLGMLIEHPGFHGIVAERGGRIIGSNFLNERSTIHGVGPITVDPSVQNQGVGRRLMQAVMDRSAARNAPGVRLCQAAFHCRALSLYTSLGFRTREPLSLMNGTPLQRSIPGYHVRPAEQSDLDTCNAVCVDVHGFHRGAELQEAIDSKTATVVERNGQIAGYATEVGFFAHAVARSNADLIALIAAAPAITGPGFIVPTRNHEVFAWCLANGLRLMQPLTLMTTGLYNEPAGAYLVCILY